MIPWETWKSMPSWVAAHLSSKYSEFKALIQRVLRYSKVCYAEKDAQYAMPFCVRYFHLDLDASFMDTSIDVLVITLIKEYTSN